MLLHNQACQARFWSCGVIGFDIVEFDCGLVVFDILAILLYEKSTTRKEIACNSNHNESGYNKQN